MTWSEVQITALQKMFATDEPITVDNLDKLRNSDDCKWYLSAMPAVANEAIQRIKPYITNMYEYNEGKYSKTVFEGITEDTSDDDDLPYPQDACVLIPLYIASQLYKDDDIAQATAYRNEFEVGLQDLIYNIENQTQIDNVY